MKHLLSTLLIFTLFVSCNSDEQPTVTQPPKVDYTMENDKEIIAYISKNKLDAERSDSGLYYVINEPGTGAQPTATSNVTVAYKGYYTSGKIVDQSTAAGLSFDLNKVIKGWTEGIPLFKEGGSGILLVPSHLGYGSFTNNGIPGGSVLVFDVKLIKVNK